MIRSLLRPIACTLAVAILLMLGATTGSAFAHEIQHAAHHNASMHATAICAWMCGTAGAVATAVLHATAITVSVETALPFLDGRSEEHTSELQSQSNLVCRLLLEKKKRRQINPDT